MHFRSHEGTARMRTITILILTAALAATLAAAGTVSAEGDGTSAYTVTYVLDGEQDGKIETHSTGDEVSVRETGTKTGYDVSGWTSDDVTIENGKFTMPAGDVTLTATGTPHTHNAVFLDYDGSEFATIPCRFGEPVTVPAENPTRESDGDYDYEFTGWKGLSADMTMGDKDMEFTPLFNAIAVQYEYIVRFVDGDGNNLSAPTSGKLSTGFSNTVSAPEVEGYTPEKTGITVTSGMVKENSTVLLRYTANPYSVIYKVGGETVFTDTVTYKTEADVRGVYDKKGYDVGGWTSEDVTIENGKFVMPAKDVTFSADATAHKHYAIFIDGDDNEIDRIQYSYDDIIISTVKTPSKTQNDQYEFIFSDKWDNLDINTVMIDEDMVFKALFDSVILLKKNTGDNSYNPSSGSEGASFTEKQILNIKNDAIYSNTILNATVGEYKICFDSEALKNLTDGAATLYIGNISGSDATKISNDLPGSDPSYYRITFGDNTYFGENGRVTVNIPLILKEGWDIENVSLYYIGSDYKKINFDYSDNILSFTTNHFSDYVVVYEEDGPGNFHILLLAAAVIAVMAMAGCLFIRKKRSA